MEHPEGEDPTLLPPALAARALGVSPATLRRYAALWERLVGPLPRDPRGDGSGPRRPWPASGRPGRPTCGKASPGGGPGPGPGRLPGPRPPLRGEALALLRALAERLERVEGELRALREENARLREALKALEPPRRRPWWRFWGH